MTRHRAMWAYPWDLADEGIEAVVKYLAEEIGINAIALSNAYHSVEHLRPRAPGAKFYRSEQAALYFEPNLALYAGTKLRHRVSEIVKDRPILPRFVEACRKHRVRPESWTVFFHNTYLAGGNPDCAEINIYGDALPYALCPSNPQARAYAVALCRDLETQGIEIIEFESLHFHGFGHSHHHSKFGVDFGGARALFDLCFCSYCRGRGEAAGIDMAKLASATRQELDVVFQSGSSRLNLQDYLEKMPGLTAFFKARQEAVTSLLQEIRQAVRAQINFIAMGDEYSAGLEMESIAATSDQVEILAYTPSAERVKSMVESTKKKIGDAGKLVVGYSVYAPFTPAAKTLLDNVQAALHSGAHHFSFYNYGIMPPGNMAWVKEAIRAADAVR